MPHDHRQRPRNPDLLDREDVHRPNGRIARQQIVGGVAERLGKVAGDLLARDPDIRLIDVLAVK